MAENKDYIVRATAAEQQLRVFACTTGGLVEKAREIHNLSPVAAAALGRLLTAGSMMGLAGIFLLNFYLSFQNN